jgi:hypothetical protein
MTDFLRDHESLLMLMLGWFMGLLSPGIVERIRRGYRRGDLMTAVVNELVGLQYTMAIVAWRIRTRNGEVTDEFIDSFLPVLESHHGPDRNERMIEGLRESRRLTEQQRATVHLAVRKPNAGLSLRQYALPLCVTQQADLAICPLEFQRAVLLVRYHLDLFNQSVPYLQSQFDKTFTGLSDENFEAIKDNLEYGYRELGERAEIIVKAIADLKERYPQQRTA